MTWIAALCFVAGLLLGAGLMLVVLWIAGSVVTDGDE